MPLVKEAATDGCGGYKNPGECPHDGVPKEGDSACQECYDDMDQAIREAEQHRADALEKSMAQQQIFRPEPGKMICYEGKFFIVVAVEQRVIKVRPRCDADRDD
jgi:hypothetical protein